jgi:hypothetical protein
MPAQCQRATILMRQCLTVSGIKENEISVGHALLHLMGQRTGQAFSAGVISL